MKNNHHSRANGRESAFVGVASGRRKRGADKKSPSRKSFREGDKKKVILPVSLTGT
jgi:hypothetical protein